MSSWQCNDRHCNFCPYDSKSCTEFGQAKLRIIGQACTDFRYMPNFVELIRLQNDIFPVILEIEANKKETKIIKDKNTNEETLKIIL
jgi:hypothetical protein